MIKDTVVLTGSEEDEVRLGFSEAISERFKGLDSLWHGLDPVNACTQAGSSPIVD